MSDENLNIDFNKGRDEFFSKGRIDWKKPETDVWAELEHEWIFCFFSQGPVFCVGCDLVIHIWDVSLGLQRGPV